MKVKSFYRAKSFYVEIKTSAGVVRSSRLKTEKNAKEWLEVAKDVNTLMGRRVLSARIKTSALEPEIN